MPLPDGYTVRHPTDTDAPAAQAVLDAAETHDTGEPRRHDDDLATVWRDPDCDLARNWWLISARKEEVVAVAWVWPEMAGEVMAEHYVRPDHRSRGLGAVLLDVIELRTSELPSTTRVGASHLVVWCEDRDGGRRDELDARGFEPERQYYEMAIDLGKPFPPARWPRGIRPRGYRPEADERRLYDADEEAFAEHFLFESISPEQWRLHFLEASGSDPTLWWLAWDGDELAGFVIPAAEEHGAVIREFAVRRPWRGRGIGRALLATAFTTLRDRGETIVRLFVDVQNVTDALRVYEAAGMRVSRRFDVMQKPLS